MLMLIGVLAAAPAWGGPIRYEQISANASGYFYVDMDRIFSSRLMQQAQTAESLAEMKRMLGSPINSVAVYWIDAGEDSKGAVLVNSDNPKVFEGGAEAMAKADDAVVISYQKQEIYYSSLPILGLLVPGVEHAPRHVHHTSKVTKAPVDKPERPELGIGFGSEEFGERWQNGPSYTAFVGNNLIVVTTDLPSMAEALDVLNGKKPSLVQQDIHGLKVDVPPGVILHGAGMTASLSTGDLAAAATQPAGNNGGSFGMDMFGSLKGKAMLGRFDMGEDEKSEYADASITMVDAGSAEQLKNLLLGVKALVTLSQGEQGALIAPLEVQSAQKNVTMHWSWPAANLGDLIRLAHLRGDDAGSVPTTTPAAQPAH
jgi:hypothetical protein